MGFDAIWISPVVHNIEGGYHGYWAGNWDKLNDNFGSADDLKSLISACHERDILVMVDVVANHVGPVHGNYSEIFPFNDPKYYHAECPIDFKNQDSVENCWLWDLPDLAQEHAFVDWYLNHWIRKLVMDYEFDGIRIDTVPHVPQWFWDKFGKSSGVFQIGEVSNNETSYVAPYQLHLSSVLNYPMYYTIKDVFTFQQNMSKLAKQWDTDNNLYQDPSVLGIFVDNHDVKRFLYEND